MNSKRLLAIASFVDKDDVVVDVGCDHAYLDIYLTINNLCKKTIATDISEGAIAQARTNINKYDLNDKITTVVSDGLECFDDYFNTIVISGMGTGTILHILNNPKAEQINKIIIQSNNDLPLLRFEMNQRGYKIAQEKVVLENDKYYTIILFLKGNQKLNRITRILGIYNIENKEYYNYLYNKNIKLLNKIPNYKLVKRFSILTLLSYIKRYIRMS